MKDVCALYSSEFSETDQFQKQALFVHIYQVSLHGNKPASTQRPNGKVTGRELLRSRGFCAGSFTQHFPPHPVHYTAQ